jgi:uncharacterized protein (DUF2164 family)
MDNGTQVRETGGRLVASFPSEEAARAFVTGYNSGIRDAADRMRRRTTEVMEELRGMAS